MACSRNLFYLCCSVLELLELAEVKIFPGVLPPVTPSSLMLEAGDLETYLFEPDLGGALTFWPEFGDPTILLSSSELLFCFAGVGVTSMLCLVEEARTCCLADYETN
jgi:hypothetical protein